MSCLFRHTACMCEKDEMANQPVKSGAGIGERSPAAVILAAGVGRRLGGRPKAALHIGGSSLLARLASALRDAGIDDIGVVLGPYRETLVPLARHCGVDLLLHGRENTRLDESQALALRTHVERRPGRDLLLVLADLPLLDGEHMRALLEEWQRRPTGIEAQMPVVEGVRGHPLLLSWVAVQQLVAAPSFTGIRGWLNGHPDIVNPFITSERAYVTDLDTPEDLAILKERLRPQQVAWPEPWDTCNPQQKDGGEGQR